MCGNVFIIRWFLFRNWGSINDKIDKIVVFMWREILNKIKK